MTQRDPVPKYILWLWSHPILVLTGLPLILVLLVFGPVLYLEGRLEQIEDRLAYKPHENVSPSPPDGDASIDLGKYPERHAYYVPCYSHIYHRGGRPILLETTLSIRNTSIDRPMVVTKVKYFDTAGAPLKSYVDQPVEVGPMATIEFLVEEHEEAGGSGANFLVEVALSGDSTADGDSSSGEQRGDHVLLESVMVGLSGTQCISFARGGVLVDERVGE
ncbi:DUF3124 domain-containing protein [Stratiformator vulcanicus]|uniref:Uncharacterized protein n=1 Tax=Stratiformator vulcanicus TaxID=2527980 RepID=A0A517QY33_9PLAN|nr:DUF3124 domain-containing protein [Stratiformator vulcanicus]QDT36524.1 hypothetical protein Pan189_08830 [Stratiformator vulcanicus]